MNFSSRIKFAALASLMVMAAACGEQNQKQGSGNEAKMPKAAQEQALVIRYVDADTLMSQYNLAKDYNESSIRMQNALDAKRKNLSQNIQSLQNEFANKEKNNVYATNPQQAQADQSRYQKALNDAQQQIEAEQARNAKQLQENNKALNDSVNNFLKAYAKENGYDVILNKAATFYIDPKCDVTADVVKGLNARYTKVAKKK